LRQQTTDGITFNISLYSCIDKTTSEKLSTIYRKQDHYSGPLQQQTIDQGSCSTPIDPSTSFICEQQPFAEGQNAVLASCDATNAAQKWRIDNIGKSGLGRNLLEAKDVAVDGGGTILDGEGPTWISAEGGKLKVEPELCHPGGLYINGRFKFEIRGSNKNNQLQMIALTPTDWLTASASYTNQTYSRDSPWVITAIFDNGKVLNGTMERSYCSRIHWGPPAQQARNVKYPWAAPCNDSDPMQIGWQLKAYPKTTTSPEYSVVYYNQYEPYRNDPRRKRLAWVGCLDRATPAINNIPITVLYTCTRLDSQKWIKYPVGTSGQFALVSYDDPNLCLDIYGEYGPAIQVYRCKGLNTTLDKPTIPSKAPTPRPTYFGCDSDYGSKPGGACCCSQPGKSANPCPDPVHGKCDRYRAGAYMGRCVASSDHKPATYVGCYSEAKLSASYFKQVNGYYIQPSKISSNFDQAASLAQKKGGKYFAVARVWTNGGFGYIFNGTLPGQPDSVDPGCDNKCSSSTKRCGCGNDGTTSGCPGTDEKDATTRRWAVYRNPDPSNAASPLDASPTWSPITTPAAVGAASVSRRLSNEGSVDWSSLEEEESQALQNYPTPRCRISTLHTNSVRIHASGQHYEAYYFNKSEPKGYNRTLNAYCGHDDYLFGCSADHGSKSGDPVCCDQKGTVQPDLKGVCPLSTLPKCIEFRNYSSGVRWGYCGHADGGKPPAHGSHAPIAFSSDSFNRDQCLAKCKGMQCTCFDFNNRTDMYDTCTQDSFLVDLTDLQCGGLVPSQDDATSPEACAGECCAQGIEQCEAWQWTADRSKGQGRQCWLGKMEHADSCQPRPGVWVGGGRPSPNQLFTLTGNGDSQVLQSPLLVNVSEGGVWAKEQICVHANHTPPIMQRLPPKTTLELLNCDGTWNQNFIFNNGTTGNDGPMTISFGGDPSSCVDGVANSPQGVEASGLGIHMWTCYTDPSIGSSKEAAMHHQQWQYNTSSKQLMLTAAEDMACTLEYGVDYYGGDYNFTAVYSAEDCCAQCADDPQCVAFSYDTRANTTLSSDPLKHMCALKETVTCPQCKKQPNQLRTSGVPPPNSSAVPKCLAVSRVTDPINSRRYHYGIYREPCVDITSPYTPTPSPQREIERRQQWGFIPYQASGLGNEPVSLLRSVWLNYCLSANIQTNDWTRTGQADEDEPQALVSVAHQPDTCLACVSSSGDVGQTCKVGDIPKITRCNGALDSSRLTWAYQQNLSATADGVHANKHVQHNSAVNALAKSSFVSLMRLNSLMRHKSFKSKVAAGAPGECIPGFTLYNFDLPLATNPVRNVSEAICRSLCDFHPGCKAYVFEKQGCSKSSRNPKGTATPDCYLKSSAGPNIVSQECSCMGTMGTPPPMCATTQLPSAGSGRDLLPLGETCSNLPRSSCCLKYDNSVDWPLPSPTGKPSTWSGQPCVPAKTGTFKWSKDNVNAVCAPQSWVIKNAPTREGSCAGSSASFNFPCRSLVDKHSGLCLTAAKNPNALSMQQCDPSSEMQRWVHDPVSTQIVLQLVADPSQSYSHSSESAHVLRGLGDFSGSDRVQHPLSDEIFNSTLFEAARAAAAKTDKLRDAADMQCVQVYIGPPVYPDSPTPAPGFPTPAPGFPTPAPGFPTPGQFPSPSSPVQWPTPMPPPTPASSGKKKSSAGAVAGGAIGALAFSAVSFVAFTRYRGQSIPGWSNYNLGTSFMPANGGGDTMASSLMFNVQPPPTSPAASLPTMEGSEQPQYNHRPMSGHESL
jgi:hypothetical protein